MDAAATEKAIQRGIEEGVKSALKAMGKGKAGATADKSRTYMPEGLVAQFLSANGVSTTLSFCFELCSEQCLR